MSGSNTKWAFLFPGQGSQSVGMGKELIESHPVARSIFAEADEALGFPLTQLCVDGPADKLDRTAYTQPALLTVSVAAWSVLRDHGVHAELAAGHSLGEYSALVAAGALEFKDAVRVVRRRGELMEEALPDGRGAMAAVLGLEADAVKDVCSEVSAFGGTVEAVNLNAPGQVVISGFTEAVEEAGRKAVELGARKVVPLSVSGPFHSSLMQSAADGLREALAQVEVRDPEIPVVCNVSAEPVSTKEEVTDALIRQVSSPVLWEDSVRRMLEMGAGLFVEVGPGRTLSGMLKRIERGAAALQMGSPADLEKVLARKKGVGVI